MSNPKIGVVYIAYFPYGVSCLKKFLESYTKHPANQLHDLIIVFKGYEKLEELQPFFYCIDSFKLKFEKLFCTANYDIGTYFSSAQKLTQDYLLFFNSQSVIQADNWLKFYWQNINKPMVGAVGATGSGASSQFSYWVRSSRPIPEYIPIYLHLPYYVVMFVYRFFNHRIYRGPHLRTNSFIINRQLFASLRYVEPKPSSLFKIFYRGKNKFKALYFEHGDFNMTYQLYDKKLEVLIIDKYGKSYGPDEWQTSNTFWINNQENLLVHDNQTMRYLNADTGTREFLRTWAWGDQLVMANPKPMAF